MLTLILTDKYRIAEQYARENKLERLHWRHVHTLDQIRGYSRQRLALVYGYRDVADYETIIAIARYHEFEII